MTFYLYKIIVMSSKPSILWVGKTQQNYYWGENQLTEIGTLPLPISVNPQGDLTKTEAKF